METAQKTERLTELLTELAGAQALERLLDEVLASVSLAQREKLGELLAKRLADEMAKMDGYTLNRKLDEFVFQPLLTERIVEVRTKLEAAFEKEAKRILGRIGEIVDEEAVKVARDLARRLGDKIRNAVGVY
jgi:hypothetical protein